MQDFRNLRVSAKARELVVAVYELTATFPAAERFGLTSQMRRAAISCGSNIAEGCGRAGDRALAASLYVSHAEACELEFQLLAAQDLGFATEERAARSRECLRTFRFMVVALIARLENRPTRHALMPAGLLPHQSETSRNKSAAGTSAPKPRLSRNAERRHSERATDSLGGTSTL